MAKFKFALPMWGYKYHYTDDDGKTVYCGARIKTWATTDKEPPDYERCMRCERQRLRTKNEH